METKMVAAAITMGMCIGASLAVGVFLVKECLKGRIKANLKRFTVPLSEKHQEQLQEILRSIQAELRTLGLPESFLYNIEINVDENGFGISGEEETIEVVRTAYNGVARQSG